MTHDKDSARLRGAGPEMLAALQLVASELGIREDFAPIGTATFASVVLNAIRTATGRGA